MHQLKSFQHLSFLLFLPALISIPTSVHAVNQTTGDAFFGPDLGDALTAVSQAELNRRAGISAEEQRSKQARPTKTPSCEGFGGEVLATHRGNASMSADGQPWNRLPLVGTAAEFRAGPQRSGNSSIFGSFGGEVLATHTRNGPSMPASPTLYPAHYDGMLSVESQAELNSLYGGFRRRKQERQCQPLVLSGCSAKWKYCGCDLPALNLSAILPDADTINIGNWNGSEESCIPSCLIDTFTPFPHRPNVSRVELTNIWAAPDNRPFPVAAYLANLQVTLIDLGLFKMYLPTITKDSFVGFVALRRLTLLNSHVSAIDIDAFSALGTQTGSGLPQLETLTIRNNNITTLDWSVFGPLMSSVKYIELENNNIQRIVRSRSYVAHALESVSLTENPNLTSVDDRFLRSVSSASNRPFLDLMDTPLCSDAAQCQRISEIYGPLHCCWVAAQKRNTPMGDGLNTTTEKHS